jgi:hypothetical protein
MGFIAGIPGIIAFFYAQARGVPAAFLDVYLPVLLLLPDYYRWVLPALPDPTFGEAAIIPIMMLFLLKNKWRFSFTDFLIFGYAAAMGYSEYLNAGFSDAQNLTFDMLGTVVFPYMLAKGIIEPKNLGVAFAKRFVMLLFWISVISLYEFRFGRTPWQLILGRFFPGQGDGWVTTFRWGFARIAGPYGHAILAGLILIIGFRIQKWLEWNKRWEAKSRHFPSLPMSKTMAITVGLIAGVIMTMVRGPWIGGIIAAVFTWIGRSRNRKAALLMFLGGIVVIGIPVGIVFNQYASVGRANAKTPSQETAAYRKELLDKYVAIAEEHAMWGWGTSGWPKVPGMPSIDNYYLLLALMHGVVSMGLLLLTMLTMTVRLTIRGMQRPPPALRGGSLAFTLAGVQVAIMITIATVFMGGQVVAIWALMTGWAEGYLLADRESGASETASAAAASPSLRFAFQRVVA